MNKLIYKTNDEVRNVFKDILTKVMKDKNLCTADDIYKYSQEISSKIYHLNGTKCITSKEAILNTLTIMKSNLQIPTYSFVKMSQLLNFVVQIKVTNKENKTMVYTLDESNALNHIIKSLHETEKSAKKSCMENTVKYKSIMHLAEKIGRASCRERV